MVMLSYPKARKPHIRGPFVYAEEGNSIKIELGGECEVDENASRIILSRFGDIIKEGRVPVKTKMVDQSKLKSKG